jgi:acetyl-CoA acyltransferase
VAIAGGVEHMHHVPIDAPARLVGLFGDPWPPQLRARFQFIPQGLSAELIAERWGISRRELEELALRSHRLAAAAAEQGRFDRELVPVQTPHGTVRRDQGIRPETTLEAMAQLPTPFKPDGRITAATSSQLSDGAAAVLLASRAAAGRLGLRPRARVADQVTVGVDPVIMLTGPIPATAKLLRRTGLALGDLDVIEINEAFASVVLAWQREYRADMDRVNPCGGAIALGHPVGATGARLFATLLGELERIDGELGLVSMCCGGGLGTGTILERVVE